MSDLLDQSLDSIIASREEGGRGRGRGRGGRGRGGSSRKEREPKAAEGAAERVITVVKRPTKESSGPDRRGSTERGRRQQEAMPFKREVADAHREGDVDGEWTHDMFNGGRRPRGPIAPPAAPAPVVRAPIQLGAKVLVTNLDKGIGADDLREIFGRVGVVKTVAIHYADDGTSKGVADVVYRHRASAEAAIAEFDGRQVDETIIRVRIIGDNTIAPAAAPAVATAGTFSSAGRTFSAAAPPQQQERRGRGLFDGGSTAAAAPRSEPPALQFTLGSTGPRHVGAAVESRGHSFGGRGGRGRGGRGGFRGGRGGGLFSRSIEGSAASENELDAAMEAYKSAAGR